MRNVDEQIRISNSAICKFIDKIRPDERGFLSQSILDKLRTFVEEVSVKASGRQEYSYNIFQEEAKPYISSRADLKFLKKFHDSLQKSVSHYSPDEGNSERLMLKYYEYLIKIKTFLKDNYKFEVLENIHKYTVNIDPALRHYYEKISTRINEFAGNRRRSNYNDRYYIRKIKPFFINSQIYYEVTFTTAMENASKFERVIAFTKLDILQNYAVKLVISNDVIEVFGKTMPIQIIDGWEVSIRPCELNNFANIFGNHPKISAGSKESRGLMRNLTSTGLNLVEVIKFSDESYQRFKTEATYDADAFPFFSILDKCRKLITNKHAGSNIIAYLLYGLNNKIIKSQYKNEPNYKLSNLNLNFGCIPFDDMPFVTSPLGHNPRIYDLFDCLDTDQREHELFARLIKNNTENKGLLYTLQQDLKNFENIDELVRLYNIRLYRTHRPKRDLEIDRGHIFINDYERTTFEIVKKLKEFSSTGIKNYSNSVESWLQSTQEVDCEFKKEIMKKLFRESRVALIYGAAGTGKTKLIEHISNFFHKQEKLFLANTNPAINNLDNRISTEKSTFQTISKLLYSRKQNLDYDLLIIDECSTVSNADMLSLLNKVSYKLVILVGDVFQIESINFGNWFNVVNSFIPATSISELTKPYRSNNEGLLKLWDKVRNIEDDILEQITANNYSANLDESIFEYSEVDEIILCLNYDGLYGINNINKFLQGNNENPSIEWGVQTYKVNDPILFNESDRFKPLIHNNLKGRIVRIEEFQDKIQFDIEIDKSIHELETFEYDLTLLGESENNRSIIRFFVNKLPSTDEDSESSSALVPFQISYAVSIHKAQGLEYNSVKVVITNEIEEMVTHNIFYTAITRAKEKLKIYWTPETEQKILKNLKRSYNNKDTHLLKSKFNL